jgi:hypothetical protein
VIDYTVNMPVIFIEISQHLIIDAWITARKIQIRRQVSRLKDQLYFFNLESSIRQGMKFSRKVNLAILALNLAECVLSIMADRILCSSLYSTRNVYGMNVKKTSGIGDRLFAFYWFTGRGNRLRAIQTMPLYNPIALR